MTRGISLYYTVKLLSVMYLSIQYLHSTIAPQSSLEHVHMNNVLS